jgi:YggT family protein
MLTDAIIFLLRAVGDFVAIAAIARFLMQTLRTGAHSPVAQFCMAVTNWAVLPLRRVLPAIAKQDTASLVTAYVLIFVVALGVFAIRGVAVFSAAEALAAIAVYALVDLLRLVIYVFVGATIIWVLLSWVNPRHPYGYFFEALSRPIVSPIRKIVPLIGGFDISPIIACLLLQLILAVPLARAQVYATMWVTQYLA